MNKLWDRYRQHSRGWEKDSIAIVHLRILLGPAFKVDNLMDDFGITHVVNCAGPEYSSKKFIEEFPGRHACCLWETIVRTHDVPQCRHL